MLQYCLLIVIIGGHFVLTFLFVFIIINNYSIGCRRQFLQDERSYRMSAVGESATMFTIYTLLDSNTLKCKTSYEAVTELGTVITNTAIVFSLERVQ